MELTFFEDPGHGWLRVPRGLISQLNISNKISSYSYQDNNYLYLEEDCDAEVFASAFEKIFKEELKIKREYREDIFIRKLDRVNAFNR